jgi:hypothetical protein
MLGGTITPPTSILMMQILGYLLRATPWLESVTGMSKKRKEER